MKTLVLNGNIRRVPEGGSHGTGLSLEVTALELGKGRLQQDLVVEIKRQDGS